MGDGNPEDEEVDVRQAATALLATIETALSDFDARTVTLTRDEAILTVGLVEALLDALVPDDLEG